MTKIKHQAAILTVSDKASQGRRQDAAGPALCQKLSLAAIEVIFTEIVPDEIEIISGRLCFYADQHDLSLILTTGGTGLSPRDVTPEATSAVLDRLVPGLAEAMRQTGLQHTPHAMLSRAVCGIRKHTLIINLPGSPRGSLESLEAVLPALPHALDKLKGDTDDCAR